MQTQRFHRRSLRIGIENWVNLLHDIAGYFKEVRLFDIGISAFFAPFSMAS